MRVGLLILVVLQAAVISATAVDLRMLVPLYSYPSWYDPGSYVWDDVAAAASQVPITAIINPNNGPDGGPPNSDYVVGLAALHDAGVTTLGYVYTSYGSRNLTNVISDIDLYAQYYNVSGIFLDEMAPGSNALPYYSQIYDYVKSKTNLPIVVSNPGTQCDESFLTRPATDTAVTFENGTGWSGYVPDPYVSRYPSSCFAALLYNVPDAATMRSNVDLAVRRNFGYVYVTDANLPNPWDGLPAYWSELIRYLKAYRDLRITSLTLTGAAPSLEFSSISNHLFALECTRDLTSNQWAILSNNIAGTGGMIQLQDRSATNQSRQFYRIRLLP